MLSTTFQNRFPTCGYRIHHVNVLVLGFFVRFLLQLPRQKFVIKNAIHHYHYFIALLILSERENYRRFHCNVFDEMFLIISSAKKVFLNNINSIINII